MILTWYFYLYCANSSAGAGSHIWECSFTLMILIYLSYLMKCTFFNNWRISPAVCNLTWICAISLSFFYLLKCVWIRQSVDCIFWWVVFIKSPCSISYPVSAVLFDPTWHHQEACHFIMFLDTKAQFVDLRGLRSGVLKRLSWQGKSDKLPWFELLGDLVLWSDSTYVPARHTSPITVHAWPSSVQPHGKSGRTSCL